MKRKFTFLMAAFMLLAFLIPVTGWGQTWEKTTPADLTTGDIIVVVDITSSKAMSNNNGTSSAPSAIAVTLNTTNDQITGTVGETIQWTLTTSGSGDSRTYQLANGTNYLYVTATNNGVRVGSGTRNTFTIVTGGTNNGYYLYNSDGSDNRWVGCYTSDWRCYTSINNNIKGNNIAFFKKITGGSSTIATTTTVTAPDGFNNDIYSSTVAGMLNAAVTVTNGGASVAGATVTWSSTNPAVATVDEQSGSVTLVHTGETVIKATYAGDETYSGSFGTYSLTVTSTDPDPAGTSTHPYTVAEARAAIDANDGLTNVYATGIVSEIVTAYDPTYHNISYNISTDGTTTAAQLQAYRGKSFNGDDFTSADDIQVGATVVIYGTLKKYNSTYEFDADNQLVTYNAPAVAVEAPTFSPTAGTYAEAQNVTISCATSGTTIYYTTDGTDPTSASTPYTSAISVSGATTIKAIAIKGDDESTVATAIYHINSDTNPYTVTQVMALHDYQLPAQNIYVNGVVSQNGASLSSGALNYYISVDGTNSSELYVFKGKGLDNASFTATTDIQVGDIVTIYGNVIDYTSNNTTTREFTSGNHLTSFARPLITPESASISVTSAETSGTLEITYNAIATAVGLEIKWYTDDQGTDETIEPAWIDAEIDGTTHNVDYMIGENTSAEDRHAYFKVYGLSDAGTDVYSNMITISQSHAVTPVINAENVNIAYSATSGAIEYTITNGSGSVTATVTPGSWLTLGTITTSEVPFTCSANDGAARTAEVTLSFTDAADKVVTVTQAAYTASYSGTGTFTKVTALTDLEDGGYYVLVYNDYAMTNSVNSDKYMEGDNTFTINNNVITNPDVTIVWKLEANNTNWNLYNEDEEKYCYIGGGSSAKRFYMGATSEYSYTVTVNEDGEFLFKSTHTDARCIANYGTTFRAYLASNNPAPAIYLYKLSAASTDPYITVAGSPVVVPSTGGTGTLAITFDHLIITQASDFSLEYYNDNDEVISAPTWMNNVSVEASVENYVVSYNIDQNDDADRSAKFKVKAMDGTTPVYSNLVTFTQNKYFTPVTYTLATSIESGRHYIMFASTSNVTRAAGAQNGDIRNAEDVTVESNGKVSVSSDNVYEFVINGPDVAGYYTIYDPRTNGFMAAGNKKFKAQSTPENWNIVFDEGNATISPATGSYTGYSVQYNASSPRFACYDSNQTAISLYVKDETAPTYDFYKYIAGYNGGDGGYYLVSTPVGANPADVTGMVTGTFDLYAFNQAEILEWRNYEAQSFDLVAGQGYLYANNANVTLHFNGTPAEVATVNLSKATTGSWKGWNLVGNPFGQVAYITKDYYRMNEDGDDFIAGVGGIDPMEGVFVVANTDGETLTFSKSAPAGAHGNNGGIAINLSQTANTRNGIQNHLIDRAIVRFGEGDVLPKFMLNSDNTRLYIPQGDNDYAVVRSEAQGEMPVNFKAAENGTYTISVEAENLDVEYLHLIDNMTGANVDLLATPSYTFEARKSDIASRFRLVFDANTGNDETNDNFAFINNGELIVNGNGTVQVIDILGRQMFSHEVNSAFRIQNSEFAPGVYVLRLVNGNNVKTQKIVIK